MEAVMNNPDLRGVIFSFFRNKNYAKCMKCGIVCRDNYGKQVCKFIKWSRFTNCHFCFYQGFLGHTKLFNPNIKRIHN